MDKNNPKINTLNTSLESEASAQAARPLDSKPSPLTPDMEKAPNREAVKWFKENSIPFAVILLLVFLLCLVGHYSSVTLDWARTKDFTDAFRNVTQGLAFIAGGVWAYFKFVKGRTFKESLVPLISGKLTSIDGFAYLIVTTQVKNVGLSKIEFDGEGSAVILFGYESSSEPEIHTVSDKRLTAFEVFTKNDRYIEPNEIIEGQRLVAMPTALKLAYRLEIEIASTAGYTWRANNIVDMRSFNEKLATALTSEGGSRNDS
jgi:hypothetical protein